MNVVAHEREELQHAELRNELVDLTECSAAESVSVGRAGFFANGKKFETVRKKRSASIASDADEDTLRSCSKGGLGV